MNNLNIKQLLERYWQGTSTLQEEEQLRNYFQSDYVAEKYKSEALMFNSFAAQKKVAIPNKYDTNHWAQVADTIPNEARVLDMRKWAMAACFTFLLGLGAFMMQQQWNTLDDSTVATTEEAIIESEKALLFLAENFGKGKSASQEIIHLKTLGNTLQ